MRPLRRRAAAFFGLDDPRLQPVLQRVATFLVPTGLCALGSLVALAFAASPSSGGGFGSSMTAAGGGVGAAFAVMFWRRLGQTIRWPTEADLTER